MDDAQLTRRLGAIERQVTFVSAQLGIDCPPFAGDAERTEDGRPAIEGADRSGHTTEAISRLRHLTGASLLEAKRAVDALGR